MKKYCYEPDCGAITAEWDTLLNQPVDTSQITHCPYGHPVIDYTPENLAIHPIGNCNKAIQRGLGFLVENGYL